VTAEIGSRRQIKEIDMRECMTIDLSADIEEQIMKGLFHHVVNASWNRLSGTHLKEAIRSLNLQCPKERIRFLISSGHYNEYLKLLASRESPFAVHTLTVGKPGDPVRFAGVPIHEKPWFPDGLALLIEDDAILEASGRVEIIRPERTVLVFNLRYPDEERLFGLDW